MVSAPSGTDLYRLGDGMKPVLVSLITSGSCGEKDTLNLFGHRSAPAGIDRHAIDFTDWRYLRSRSSEECFVGSEQIVHPQRAYFYSIAKVARDLHHRLTSDAEENRVAFVIGYQLPIAHDEKILTSPFGD